ncbi:histone-lysine N-methyltransferase SETD2-like, partial [Notothenia coriiceps]|uniref:Histone-lysine N-methyltransferase SETD2-like n=1 Tax=Notothenia coriiceps TaxID=8208 RepID=A0A6I9P5X5_9TELE
MEEPCDLKHFVKEEGSNASVKVEGLSKAALIKSLSPRVMLSNHLLPKGTKMKVNLEDQGRQKVSFGFAPTKKPLQSPFFLPASPDKSVDEPNAALSQSTSEVEGQNTDIEQTEQNQTPMVQQSIAEIHSPTPVAAATKLKTDLPKMHFKKQILSVSVTEENPTTVVPEEPNSPELQVLQKPTSEPEFPTPQPQNVLSLCPSENNPIQAPDKRVTPTLKKPAAPSGKDGESSSCAEQVIKVEKTKTRSHSDSAHPGSESDGDSGQMSSSRKSVDSKSKANSDSRSKEIKKSSSSSHVEEKEKSYSRRSENNERSSSYSKSERDPRHTSSRSSRSDKDRKRSRSRSRSKSKGSRTSSSHSRSERSRGDRGSRSERSYYHDSDRRSHRSSPRRERRRSRSRTDRTRDSSDSEDDHRKTRTRTSDSSKLSSHSTSHKDSKSSSYSKSEKVSKSSDFPQSSEFDKRTKSSKSERTSKRLSDSDSQLKCSPDLDSSYHKSSTHHKSETNSKSSSSSMHTNSQTCEKRQKSSSNDSEADHKGKSKASEKMSGREDKCKNYPMKTSRPDSKQMTPSRFSGKTSGHDKQSDYIFHSPGKALSNTNTTEAFSRSEKEKNDSLKGGNECSGQNVKEMVSCPDEKSQESSLKRSKETKSSLDVDPSAITPSENLKHAALENVTNVKDSPSSNNRPHLNSDAAVLNSCSSNDSILCNQDKNIVDCLPGPKSLEISDVPVTHDVQQNTKPVIVKDLTAGKLPDTNLLLKSELSCLESEDQLTIEQQNMDTVQKNSSASKKSRWDIVGQNTSESDNLEWSLCAESTPSVKKVISVKQIEVSKDNNQQDSDINKHTRQGAETHSKLDKQTKNSRQEVGSDSPPISDKYKDQSETSQASTSIDHCDLKLRVCQKFKTDEPMHVNDASQVDKAAKMQSWNGDGHEDKSRGSTPKNKLSNRTLLNQDGLGGQSEVSDSDNSEYDSDCGEAIKRLHSVVVVPKNSSLIGDAQDTGASPSNLLNNSQLQNANINEVPIQGTQQRQGAAFSILATSGPCDGLNDSSQSSMLCQSQSNMIDSTSHSEGSSSIGAQRYMAGQIVAHGSATDPAHSLDNSRQREQGHTQHNVSSRGERMQSNFQPDADNINDKNGLSLGWEFSHPEQPSTTYQLPDSSHGPHLANTKLAETSAMGQEQKQSNATWNHQSPNTQTIRQPYLHVHEHYPDPAGEIHPDSLTNDQDDFSEDKLSNLGKTAVECAGLQGHEISSNSRGSALPDAPREDNLRPHRGRGPPKKRRPEIESDSDNEAEAGPAGKRERPESADVSKETHVRAEVQRPLLNLRDFQDSSKWREFSRSKKMPPYFDLIEENLYLTERKKSKSHRDIKRMQCECPVLPREERSRGVLACGEDCLNRLLMIECSSRCLNGHYCSNRRFQMKQHADFEVILTEDKGWGLRAAKDLIENTFVLEYCGEVLDHKEFKTRVKEYARNKNIHYYFMALKNNEIIDATLKGNCSRFMNHSCEPNCETQK